MMVNTDDLVEILRERSVHDRLPPGAGLYERIVRSRRRRFAGRAAVVVALFAAVAVPFAVLQTGGGRSGVADPSATDPAPPPPVETTRPTNDAERMPAEYTAGYRLAASRDATLPAENTFTYTFTPASYDFQLLLWCDSARGSRLRASVNGRSVVTDYCEPAGKRQEITPYVHSQAPNLKQQSWEHFGVRQNVPVTVTVTVYSGFDESPAPATAPGRARLLLYLPVAFADYPFPPAPKVITPYGEDPPVVGEIRINRMDAFELAITQNAPTNHYHAFSVTRQSGRDVRVTVESRGPGVVRIRVDQRVEVLKMEFWDWNGFSYSFTIDESLLPIGRSTALSIDTEGFTAPVWRVTADDVPVQPKGG
jgi:hypothetical protein